MVEVRGVSVEELQDVLDVWGEADAEPTVTDDEDGLRALLDHARDALLVAVDSERIVGTLIIGWDGWRGSFYRLAVVPDRRREGIARRLVAAGEQRLRGLGARRLAVFAVTGDPGAVAFWRAIGYEAQADRQRLVKNIPVSLLA
jgi:ribosomal protein S18 acetylase RimI-like enzyme